MFGGRRFDGGDQVRMALGQAFDGGVVQSMGQALARVGTRRGGMSGQGQ